MPERFADIATTVAQLLQNVVGPGHAGITTPANLAGLLPYARATRNGGPRDRVSDYARITVDTFDTDYTRGHRTAEDISAYLEAGWLRNGAVLLDRVDVDSAPQEVGPWAPGVFRWEARYTIVSRRYTAA